MHLLKLIVFLYVVSFLIIGDCVVLFRSPSSSFHHSINSNYSRCGFFQQVLNRFQLVGLSLTDLFQKTDTPVHEKSFMSNIQQSPTKHDIVFPETHSNTFLQHSDTQNRSFWNFPKVLFLSFFKTHTKKTPNARQLMLTDRHPENLLNTDLPITLSTVIPFTSIQKNIHTLTMPPPSNTSTVSEPHSLSNNSLSTHDLDDLSKERTEFMKPSNYTEITLNQFQIELNQMNSTQPDNMTFLKKNQSLLNDTTHIISSTNQLYSPILTQNLYRHDQKRNPLVDSHYNLSSNMITQSDIKKKVVFVPNSNHEEYFGPIVNPTHFKNYIVPNDNDVEERQSIFTNNTTQFTTNHLKNDLPLKSQNTSFISPLNTPTKLNSLIDTPLKNTLSFHTHHQLNSNETKTISIFHNDTKHFNLSYPMASIHNQTEHFISSIIVPSKTLNVIYDSPDPIYPTLYPETFYVDCVTLVADTFRWTEYDANFAKLAIVDLVDSLEETPLNTEPNPYLQKRISSTLESVTHWSENDITTSNIDDLRHCVVDMVQGRTITQKSVEYGLYSVLQTPFFNTLIDKDAIERTDRYGNTLLHLAALSQSPATTNVVIKISMKYLESPKARLAWFEARNVQGLTALQLAQVRCSVCNEILKNSYGTLKRIVYRHEYKYSSRQ